MEPLTEDQVQSIFAGGYIPPLLSTKEMDFLIGLTESKLKRMGGQLDQVESLYRRLLIMRIEMGVPPEKFDSPVDETKPIKSGTNGRKNGTKSVNKKKGGLSLRRLTPKEIREDCERNHAELLKREQEEVPLNNSDM